MYPPAIRSLGAFSEVRNLTLVNPYRGVYFGQHSLKYETDASGNLVTNGASVKRPTVRNVYGTPLKEGVRIDKTSSTPRVQNVRFNPVYWAECGLNQNPPSTNQIINAIKSEGGVGFSIGAGAGGGNYLGIESTGYAIGLENTDESSSRVFDFLFANCTKGITLKVTAENSWQFTSGRIVEADELAVLLSTNCRNTRFNSVEFSSNGKLIKHLGGHASFVNCQFTDWGQGVNQAIKSNNENPNPDSATTMDAIYGLQIASCLFGNRNGAGTCHIKIGGALETAILIHNNELNGNNEIVVQDSTSTNADVTIAGGAANFPILPDTGWFYQASDRRVLPGNVSIYNVREYGATGNGQTNDSPAVKSAIATAQADGAGAENGAIIYFPAGAYKLNSTIEVPSWMELRGVNNSSVDSGDVSSLLIAGPRYASASDQLVILKENAGMQGLGFYNPNQQYSYSNNVTEIIEFPAFVKGNGNNWAYHMVLANGYDNIKFTGGGGHHLDFVYCSSINDAITVSSDDGEGRSYIENLQIKNAAWGGIAGNKLPAFEYYRTNNYILTENLSDSSDPEAAEDFLGSIGNGVRLNGDGQFSLTSCFINRSHKLYKIVGSPDATFITTGGEGHADAKLYTVDSTEDNGGDLKFSVIGSSSHTGGTYGTFATKEGDQISIYNSKMYYAANKEDDGKTHINFKFSGGGSLLVQQNYNKDWVDKGVAVADTLAESIILQVNSYKDECTAPITHPIPEDASGVEFIPEMQVNGSLGIGHGYSDAYVDVDDCQSH